MYEEFIQFIRGILSRISYVFLNTLTQMLFIIGQILLVVEITFCQFFQICKFVISKKNIFFFN